MSSTSVGTRADGPVAAADGADFFTFEERPTPEAETSLGRHPLWQDFLAVLEASRTLDIAEANRQADMEAQK